MTQKKDDPTLASLLGQTLALVQHGFDKAANWGFRKMKDASRKDSPAKEPESPALRTAARAGKSVLRFLGAAGEEFYKSYDELKRKEDRSGK